MGIANGQILIISDSFGTCQCQDSGFMYPLGIFTKFEN